MKYLPIVAVALLATGAAHAATSPAQARYNEAVKTAKAQYASNRALCADETSSKLRLQCLGDAKAQYTAALSSAKAELKGSSAALPRDEGKVVAVHVQEKEGEGSAVGLIAGGVVGGLLGNQVGAGTGRDLATIAGAAGGAYAGREVEKRVNKTKIWVVAVRFNDGKEQTFSFKEDPAYRAGDLVRRAGESIQRR